MKREEILKAENILNKLWTFAVGKKGYNKKDWQLIQTALWAVPDCECGYCTDCTMEGYTKQMSNQ